MSESADFWPGSESNERSKSSWLNGKPGARQRFENAAPIFRFALQKSLRGAER
jgi:hypothetical protein